MSEPSAGLSAESARGPESSSNEHGAVGSITTHNPHLGNRLGIADAPAVTAATIDRRRVHVEFSDGQCRTFAAQWLRHCCWCAECGNPSDGIRFVTVASFPADITPTLAEADEGDLVLTWPDGHRSTYSSDWLAANAYDDEARQRRAAWQPTTWRAELANCFPTVDWDDASDGGVGQLGAYRLLCDYGIVRIDHLGTDPRQTEQLANLVGPIHETTVYGRIYDVRAEPVAKLGAKTGMAQAPHIDDAFYYSPPGIDIFHCLSNTDVGGMSTYVDGFAIAESLRLEEPAAYEALTTLPVTHVRRHPGEINMRSRSPLIRLDEFGRPSGVRYFDRALGPLDVPAADVDRLYDAIRAFSDRMASPEFTAVIRVEPGQGVLIDNHRVMHGRTEFDPASGRHIRLCHVPRDEFHGRLRELSLRLDPWSHDQYLPQGS
ncbi:TauD/TfdA family dioxygenase [Candidatus Poriferisodalis sp.]|uniref:TauD/TfdA family dioxygenase n=1 Tax=Candidatus Poriferisodalis sp. TaxID=3101277 RepID=UPI003AF70736